MLLPSVETRGPVQPRIAAFSNGSNGGNPAGVVLCDALPDAAAMQAVAAEVGYSETVFAAPAEDCWRVRDFAPEVEVDFFGHATIALGAALALRQDDGTFALQDGVGTFDLIHAETPRRFRARNPFPISGVYEDPGHGCRGGGPGGLPA